MKRKEKIDIEILVTTYSTWKNQDIQYSQSSKHIQEKPVNQ